MNQAAITTRRTFLKAATAATAVFGSGPALLGQGTRRAATNAGAPRKIIFMVSDGMNHGALSLAQHYLSCFHQRQTNWARMYRELPVVRSLVETFSANNLVTDSAAAASAWGCGCRVNNGALNVTPQGQSLLPLQSLLRESDIPTGLVSTATITHATPAGFAATVGNRNQEELIARQYLERRVPVLLGGGARFFPENLRQAYTKAGYEILHDKAGLLKAAPNSAKPVLGTFASGYMPYAIDRQASPEQQAKCPSLREMAEFAVARLDAISSGRWLVMVEGARIDHCGHANDAAASIHEQLDFDDALGAMLRYTAGRDDTLLVVTTDHGCGGIQLNGTGSRYGQPMAPGTYHKNSAGFGHIARFKHSLEWLRHTGGGLSGPPLRDFIQRETGLVLTQEDLARAQGFKHEVTQLFGSCHGIKWTSGEHTGELVEFCALGPGSHRFPAFMANHEFHPHLLKALALA